MPGRTARPRRGRARRARPPATASAIPTRTSGGGTPSRTIPAVTGMSAAMTPVTGATIPIRPTASPRYSAVIPIPPAIAGEHAPAEIGLCRQRSRRATSARTSASAIPTSCDTRTTPNSGVRRDSRPPPKSPPPQASAETRPRTIVAVWAEPSSFRGDVRVGPGRRLRRQGQPPGPAPRWSRCRGRSSRPRSMSAASGAPLSTLVGPSSTTTASAASS